MEQKKTVPSSSDCRLLSRRDIVIEVQSTAGYPEHPQLRTGVKTPGWPADRSPTELHEIPGQDPHTTPDNGCY